MNDSPIEMNTGISKKLNAESIRKIFRTKSYMNLTKKEAKQYWEEEIVIPTTKEDENQIIIKVDYPLDTAFLFFITKDTKQGFTRSRLQHEISEIYNMISKDFFKDKNEIWGMYGFGLEDLNLRSIIPRYNSDIFHVKYWELNIDSEVLT
jgi:uncharacterized protein YprB with RNaseH-like and TPR domain